MYIMVDRLILFICVHILLFWTNCVVNSTAKKDVSGVFLSRIQALTFLHHRSKRDLNEECREGCFYEEAAELGMNDAQIKSFMLSYKCSCCLTCSSDYYCSNTNTDYGHINNLQIACKRDGGWSVWSTWTSWSTCSATCEQGTWSRSHDRTCTNPSTDGGVDCSGQTSESETSSCTIATCLDVAGTWSDWSDWTDVYSCPVTCGGSTNEQTRSRNCSDNSTTTSSLIPVILNVTCDGSSTDSQNVTCNNQNCPVNGSWSVWTSWSTCSVTCDNGTTTRSRDCNNPEPQYGGVNCTGDSSETDICATNVACPVSCTTSQYTCNGDGLCIDLSAQCDGVTDCSQEDDENGCTSSSSISSPGSSFNLVLFLIIGGAILGFLTVVICSIIVYNIVKSDRNSIDIQNNRNDKGTPYKTTKVQNISISRTNSPALSLSQRKAIALDF